MTTQAFVWRCWDYTQKTKKGHPSTKRGQIEKNGTQEIIMQGCSYGPKGSFGGEKVKAHQILCYSNIPSEWILALWIWMALNPSFSHCQMIPLDHVNITAWLLLWYQFFLFCSLLVELWVGMLEYVQISWKSSIFKVQSSVEGMKSCNLCTWMTKYFKFAAILTYSTLRFREIDKQESSNQVWNLQMLFV